MSVETRCVNTIRVLAAALPEAAKSGHPGAPMGCSPIAFLLYGKLMRHNPKEPQWIARDRFVLSNGHACALQYTMLHLSGYGITKEELQNFRQLGSRTAGHPERELCPGIEVTTGPLGQGLAQAVGLAAASKMMAAKFNKPGFQLFSDRVYCIVGDGCLQEGVTSEASSLAGHWGLNNLTVFYDSNGITIDGDTSLSFTENVAKRYEAYGWQVLQVEEADENLAAIEKAVAKAQATADKPTIIVCHTTIGYGSENQGEESTHGAPLGNEDLLQARQRFGLPTADIWEVQKEVYDYFEKHQQSLDKQYQDWTQMLGKYEQTHPELAKELRGRLNATSHPLTRGAAQLKPYKVGDKDQATRALSGIALNAVAAVEPAIVGGSADLQTSNSCGLKNESDFQRSNYSGRYIRFGIREHGMAAITNGIMAYGTFRPFCATFANFVTYAWGAVRLSALSGLGVLYIATHDSIELGEDGPTHQPVEVAALCRATPNCFYVRPCDGNEVNGAYAVWLAHPQTPMVLALCRSGVPVLEGTDSAKVERGGYILRNFAESGKPKCIIGASGTEVKLAVEAASQLSSQLDVRVVSMPCWELFRAQGVEYIDSVVCPAVPSLYVEAANTIGAELWFSASLGMVAFGASGPKGKVQAKYGFTVPNVCATAIALVQSKGGQSS